VPASGNSILLDQNIPYEVTAWLDGFLANCMIDHAYDLGLSRFEDHEVFAFAQQRGSMIVSCHEDFADRRLFPVGRHCAIIRLRVEPTTAEVTCAALQRLFSAYDPAALRGKLVIVQQHRIRVIPE